MSGHKLLQYRIKMYLGMRAMLEQLRYSPLPQRMRALSKCGIYKRKLRKVMDQVEEELYGETRAHLKLIAPILERAQDKLLNG